MVHLISSPVTGWLLSASVFPLANALVNLSVRRLPIFMDSIFTIFAAASLGPFQGILVAILTNGWIEVLNGFPGKDLPFAACGVLTALIVAGFSRKGRRWTPGRLSSAILALTLANAVLGAAIATFVFGGGTGARVDTVASGFALVVDSIFSAAFLARLPVNFLDKALSAGLALGLWSWLRRFQAQEGSKTPAR